MSDLVDLIIFEKDVFTIVERALEIIKSIIQSAKTHELIRTFWKMRINKEEEEERE